MEQPLLYLDNNATTRIAPEVFQAMVPFLTEHCGNPSSAYRYGKFAADAIKRAREQVASLLRCEPREIIFTSCGTESDNAAIQSAIATTRKKHVVTTQVEHSAIIKYGEHLEKRGHGVTWLQVDSDGQLDLSQFESSIRDDTAIVSIMWANNETGVLFPIEEIAAICQKRSVLFHTDAVQTPGKIPLDLSRVPVHLLSLSGHKLHAPKGVGVLFVRRQTRFAPFVLGGGQESGKRGGTENVASIVGLGRACELASEKLLDEQTRVRALRDRLESTLLAKVPGASLNGHRDRRLPNTTSLCFPGAEAEAVLHELDARGICASAGSACTTGSLDPSHVLTAMGRTPEQARSSIRFSLSHDTRDTEIDSALEIIPAIVNRLRQLSPSAAAAA